MVDLNKFFFPLITLLLVSKTVGAARYEIKSVESGQAIYEIVVNEGNEGPVATELPSGIYKIDPKTGENIAIKHGRVLGVNRGFNGIFAQFEPAGRGRETLENALAVVDGVMTLFNRNSTIEQKESVIQIGQKGFLPVDISHGGAVSLPPILDVDDIHLVAGPRFPLSIETMGQTYLVSIRGANPLGSGFTIAFVVEASIASEKSAVSLLNHRAYVLDYQFLSVGSLTAMLASRHFPKFYSQTMNGLIETRLERYPKNGVVSSWLHHLKKFRKVLQEGITPTSEAAKDAQRDEDPAEVTTAGVPIFDLIKERIYLPQLVGDVVMSEPQTVVQTVNPLTDKWSVHVGVNIYRSSREGGVLVVNEGDHTKVAEGRIHYLAASREYRVFGGSKDSLNNNASYLLSVDNGSLLLIKSESANYKSIHLEGLNLGDIKAVNIAHRAMTVDKTVYDYVVLSSKTTTGRQKTTLLVLETKDAHARTMVLRSDEIMDKAFISQKELEMRLQLARVPVQIEGEPEQAVVFDNVTRVLGPAQYQSRLKEKTVSTPYLNLTAKYILKKGRDSQTYLRHLKEVTLRSRALIYREYDGQGADIIRTGFYLPQTGQSDGPERNWGLKFLLGELMKSPHAKKDGRSSKDNPDPSEIFLDQTNLPLVSADRTTVHATLSVFPYNPDPGKKLRKNSFGLGILVDAISTPGETISPFLLGLPITGEWETFLGAKIVKAKRKKSNEFTVLLFFRSADDSASRSGIFSLHFSAQLESTLQTRAFRISQQGTGWLTREGVFPQVLKHRLKSDGPGNLYWVHTPEISHELAAYAVRRLSDPGKLVYPNKERFNLRQAELFDENEKWKSGLFSRWQVLTAVDVKSQEPWFDDEHNRYNATLEEARKNGKLAEVRPYIDPNLQQYLDGFADPTRRQENQLRQVVLVEERFKRDFLKQLYLHFLVSENRFGVRTPNSKFDFYTFDPTATDREIKEELAKIAERTNVRDSLLLVSLQKILDAGELVEEDEDSPPRNPPLLSAETDGEAGPEEQDDREMDESEYRDFRTPPVRVSRLFMLGTNGKSRRLRDLKHPHLDRSDVPMLILATPQEWAQAQSTYGAEFEAGLGQAFTPNFRFLTSGWTLWAPDQEHAARDVKEIGRIPVTREEYQVFPDLGAILLDAATGVSAGKQRIILVPEEIKPLVNKLLLSLWATRNSELIGKWHNSNPELSVFRVQGEREANTQEKIIENFHAIQGATIDHNAVLLADMEAILNIGRPYTKGKEFLLVDPAAATPSGIFLSGRSNAENKNGAGENFNQNLEKLVDEFDTESGKKTPDRAKLDQLRGLIDKLRANLEAMGEGPGGVEPGSHNQMLPHLMWWIMSAGQKIQPKKNRNWTLASENLGKHTTLIVSTNEEFERVEAELSFESKFVDLRDHFDLIQLPPPAESVKFSLINALFDRPEVRSMTYRFQLPGVDDENEARRQLISHLVNRTEQIALQENIESTTAFVKTFTELRRALVESVELRRSRTIDKDFLERLFSRVFPMPLNLSVLESQDPLRKLQNTRQALRRMQELGYEGSDSLKRQVFDNILSQTTNADEGRPIPSSMIIIGDTSTGKTFLVRSVIKLMDLKLYDMNSSNNEEAGAIIINCANLTQDEQNSDPAKMSVRQALRNVEDLLSQPNGHRSLILWDDAHKCPNNEVYDAMMGFVQGLFEAPGGIIYTRRKGNEELRAVPVRNLTVVMTLNPTRNRDRIKRYAREGREDDLTSIVLAALARDGRDLEESVLARWSLILNLDKFPRAAKVPALLQRIRGASRRGSRMVLVEPEAVDRLVDKYPNAHAREFLSPAATAMTSIPPAAPEATMYIVSPREVVGNGAGSTPAMFRTNQTLDPHALNSVVRSINQIDAVTKDNVDSILRLINFIMHGMRTQIFNQLVLEAQNSEALNLGIPGMGNIAKQNFVLAMATHVLANRRIPVSEMVINPSHMNFLSGPLIEELFDRVAKPEGAKPYFPIEFAISQIPPDVDPRGFLAGSGLGTRERTRAEVIAQTTKKVEEVLRRILRFYLRVNSNSELQNIVRWKVQDVHRWFEQLTDREPEDVFKAAIDDIIAVYKTFLVEFNDPTLGELQGNAITFNYYDQARIFAYIVDQALMHLPWGVSAKFALDVMEASRDLSLGQKPAFIAYAYSQNLSPFAIVSPDFLHQVLPEGITVDGINRTFQTKCEQYLRGGFHQ